MCIKRVEGLLKGSLMGPIDLNLWMCKNNVAKIKITQYRTSEGASELASERVYFLSKTLKNKQI